MCRIPRPAVESGREYRHEWVSIVFLARDNNYEILLMNCACQILVTLIYTGLKCEGL